MLARIETRRPGHTGEHVRVEPLRVFLKRDFYMRTGGEIPARAAWSPSLSDYDLRGGKPA